MTIISPDYEPRELFEPLHHRDLRWACVVAHRRAGKTVACVGDLLERALYTRKPNPRYAYIAPFYRQAKDVAWQYIKDMGGNAIEKIRESELRVELVNGAWITLYGADNPDTLRGLYFDGVVLDEYGDCRPSLWAEVVLPTLADRKGWAIFIGTPKGRNHFYQIYQRSLSSSNWLNMTLKASDTGIIDQEELDEMRAQMSDEQYRQEMECSFDAAVLGTYYAKLVERLELAGQIQPTVPAYDPEFPVSVVQDLGYTDSTALWFWQKRPDGFAIIDYEEAHSVPLEYYFNLLEHKGYNYETVWLPHDARAKSLQTGRSTIEQYLARGYPARIVPNLKVQHGIDAARLVLPNCWFNYENCYDGIEALRAYRRSFNEVTKSFSDHPVHDWSSHGADAFRYFALVAKNDLPQTDEQAQRASQPRLPPKPEFRLDELFEERERRSRFAGSRMRI